MAVRTGESFSDMASLPQTDDERMLEYTMDFVFMVEDRMDELGMSRADLARKLGCRRSQVTKVLSGSNVTLKTIAKYDAALSLGIRLLPESKVVSSTASFERVHTDWAKAAKGVPYRMTGKVVA